VTTCDVCGRAERQGRLIRYSYSQGDRLIVVDHVPAEVCPNCGEVSLQPDVVQRLQETVWQQRAPVRVIETPVYEFSH
jgi:HTH-type transcriptional regulator / antitoxin MqsA